MAAIYRVEPVGSILRPAYLKQARQDFASGRISTSEFKRIEDTSVNEAIELQERVGLEVVTDGEMRRSTFMAPLCDVAAGFSLTGVKPKRWHKTLPSGEVIEEEITMPLAIVDKIERRRSLLAEEFAYARARTSRRIKVTIPSPLTVMSSYHPSKAYPRPFEMFADCARVLRQEVQDLAQMGCDYIQVDAPELATIVDDSEMKTVEPYGITRKWLLGEGLELVNSIADAPGVSFAMHMCRGNRQGHWIAQGGYEGISKSVYKNIPRYEVLLLEYDDYRSGSFEPLADIPTDKRVMLGLITTKHPTIEPIDGVCARIEEAAKFFPRDQLGICTQCGFASSVVGNPITAEVQEQKLRLMIDIAHRMWG